MELFHESKNRYFSLVLKLLNLAHNGLEEEVIKEIIEKEEYEEKVIGKDFKSFDGLILNKYERQENLNLLKKDEDKYYPVISNKKDLPVPIRFTTIEKQWLKECLKDKGFRALLSESTAIRLDSALEKVKTINNSQIIEKTNMTNRDDVKYTKETYENLKIIIKAIRNENEIVYNNVDKLGNKYIDVKGAPLRIEYSFKDNLFRISMYFIKEARPVMVNIHTISNIRVLDYRECALSRDEINIKIKANKYCKEPIILELRDEKEAMERCFMSFSSFQRSTRIIGENRYEVKISYYDFEEDEVIRRILSLGPFVKVIAPFDIKDKVIEILKRAYGL